MLIVVRRCIITGSGKGEKEYTILPKAKKGQVIPIRQIVMNVPHIILLIRRIAAEKEAERLRRKRESNRKYMKKIREKSKEFAEHERIAEEKSSDSNVCVEQNATSKSNRQKVKGEKIA